MNRDSAPGFHELPKDLPLPAITQRGLHLYLFGSSARHALAPNDVDLLLVYADGQLEGAHQLAEQIRGTFAVPPYDVLVASETEAASLDLVAKQGATLIWGPEAHMHSEAVSPTVSPSRLIRPNRD